MPDVQQLLSDFIAADKTGGDPDPTEYLKRVEGTDHAELEALIDAYLARAPRRAFDAEAFEASPARFARDDAMNALGWTGGEWPALLPKLRDEAQIKRSDLVARLAAEIGAERPEQAEKVADYYHAMEQGLLPAARVSDRVLEALGRIVGRSADALRDAGRALVGSGPHEGGPAAVFARVANPDPDYADEAAEISALEGGPEGERDFVDELFTGGSEAGR